jgi:predicted PurR-regulated permease PerM
LRPAAGRFGAVSRRGSPSARRGPPTREIVRVTVTRMLVALGIVALALVAWYVHDILILVFAAVLTALLLRTLASQVERWTPLGPTPALIVVLVALAALLGGMGYFFGARVLAEARALLDRLPDALEDLRARLGLGISVESMAESAAEMALEQTGTLVGRVGAFLFGTAAALLNVVIVIVGGIYFAAQPGLYRRGLIWLLSPLGRENARRTLDSLNSNLRKWLVGQLLSMVFVAVATTTALLLLGVPSAIALGIFAGLAEFVPIIGPFVAAVPALLIAAGEGGTLVLWTAGAYFLIQQLESNVALPLIQREMVSLPPAIMIFSILVFGSLFGWLGILFAAPLTVAAFVLVRELYPAEPEADERAE